jgi:thiol:disulfide interchange protein DsbC
MKKVFLLAMVFAMSLFSATNEEIINHFKSMINLDGLEYKIKTRQDVKGYDGYEFAIIEISQPDNASQDVHHDGRTQTLRVIIKDNLIFPEAVDVIKNRSLLEDFVDKQ